MIEFFSEVSLTPDAAAYVAQGLRALAACDGLHVGELALVEEFERGLGIAPTDGADFEVAGGGPLASDAERDLFLASLQLLALADGRISAREEEWIEGVAADLGIDAERRKALAVRAKKYLLGSLAGVEAFRSQAEEVGRTLGLTDAQIAEVLGPDQPPATPRT